MRQVKALLLVFIAVSLMLLNVGLTLAQEEANTVLEEIPSSAESQIQWLWGEVVSVDSTNKTLLVKYFDYETDSERQINIVVDDKTTYENVSSIDEITPLDTVSIDYIIDAKGKNIAENISVEKPEGSQVPQEEITTE